VPYHYALADHGRTLATRPLGEALRAELVQRAKGNVEVVLDFSDIRSTSHSFADEFVAQLVEEAKCGNLQFEVSVFGATEDVERVVRRALERRGLDLPVLV
jgi:predicted secreted protein